MPDNKKKKTVGLLEKLGFMSFSTSTNIVFNFKSTYYKFFLTSILLIDPVDGNRFRVRDRREVVAPGGWASALFALTAVAAAVTLHPAAIAATALLALLLVVKWLLKW